MEWNVPSQGMPSTVPPSELAHALLHLARRLVGEGHGEDFVRPRAPRPQQMRDARGQNPRLARAGARKHQHRPVRALDSLALLGVKPLQIRRLGGKRLRSGDFFGRWSDSFPCPRYSTAARGTKKAAPAFHSQALARETLRGVRFGRLQRARIAGAPASGENRWNMRLAQRSLTGAGLGEAAFPSQARSMPPMIAAASGAARKARGRRRAHRAVRCA